MVDTLIGQKFNMLTVIRRVDNRETQNSTHTKYVCLCDCGKATVVSGHYLKNGHTKSCGCLIGLRKVKEEVKGQVDYDGSRKIAMRMWKDIKIACYEKGNPLYNGYSLCEQWKNFDNFYEWFQKYNINEPCKIMFKKKIKIYSPRNCFLVRKKGIDARALPKIK